MTSLINHDLATGNLLWSEHNGIRTEFTYDQYGRIHKEIQPYDAITFPTTETNYTFDSTSPETILVKQRTTQNLSFDTYYYYDGLGNLVQIKTPAEGGMQGVKNFFYDGLGRVTEEQNPYFDTFSAALSTPSATAPSTTYTYDALGRVTNVTHPDGAIETVVFDRGNISTYDANGRRKDYFTDALDRITKITEYNFDDLLKDGTIYQYNTTYGYDAADQLISINDTYGNQYRFTYDKLGRRIRLNDPDIGEWNYTYDLAGNLVSQAGGGGNLISGDGFYREYNALNQLVLVRNGSSDAAVLEQYSYDPEGMRVRVWRNDSAQTVVYTPFRELMQIRNISGVFDYAYIYDGSTLVARVNPDDSKWYYHPDHLGSTTLITDESGAIVEETFYEPYGAVTSGGTAEVKLYTGQFNDGITNQYYYGSRYYNPAWGRFIQPDSLLPNIYDPQLLNRYSYVKNSPYKYLDREGHSPVEFAATGIENFNKYLASYLLGRENEKNNRKNEYETLYQQYRNIDLTAPADPYIRVLEFGSPKIAVIRYEERIDFELLQLIIDEANKAENIQPLGVKVDNTLTPTDSSCSAENPPTPCSPINGGYKGSENLGQPPNGNKQTNQETGKTDKPEGRTPNRGRISPSEPSESKTEQNSKSWHCIGDICVKPVS